MVYAYGFCLDDRRNQKCGRSLFQMHLDLQLHVLLCSCYVRCRFPYMSIIFRKVNIKRSFNRYCFIALLNFIICTIVHLTGVQIILRQCQQHTQSLLLLSLLSFLLSGSDIGIIGSKRLPVVLWTAYYNAFCDF